MMPDEMFVVPENSVIQTVSSKKKDDQITPVDQNYLKKINIESTVKIFELQEREIANQIKSLNIQLVSIFFEHYATKEKLYDKHKSLEMIYRFLRLFRRETSMLVIRKGSPSLPFASLHYVTYFLEFIVKLLEDKLPIDLFCIRNIEHENDFYSIKEFYYLIFNQKIDYEENEESQETEKTEETEDSEKKEEKGEMKEWKVRYMKYMINLFQRYGLELNKRFSLKLNNLEENDQIDSHYDFGPKCKYFCLMLNPVFYLCGDVNVDFMLKNKSIKIIFKDKLSKMDTKIKEIYEFFEKLSFQQILSFCSNTHYPNEENENLYGASLMSVIDLLNFKHPETEEKNENYIPFIDMVTSIGYIPDSNEWEHIFNYKNNINKKLNIQEELENEQFEMNMSTTDKKDMSHENSEIHEENEFKENEKIITEQFDVNNEKLSKFVKSFSRQFKKLDERDKILKKEKMIWKESDKHVIFGKEIKKGILQLAKALVEIYRLN